MNHTFILEYSNHTELISQFKGRPGSMSRPRSRPESMNLPRSTPHDDTPCTPMSGYLQQRSQGRWHKSWWVLEHRILYRYEAIEDPRAAETIPILGWTLVKMTDRPKIPHTWVKHTYMQPTWCQFCEEVRILSVSCTYWEFNRLISVHSWCDQARISV